MTGALTLVVLVAFEAIAVATAMPVIASDLSALAFYAWGFSAVIVGQLFATVVAGELCDRHGPSSPLVVGCLMFAAGLLVAGSAVNMLMFVLGRFLQGLGGGAVFVSLFVVIGRGIPADLRPRAFSYQSTAWLMPALVGPFVAGAVAQHLSWRWLFFGLLAFVPVPMALVLPRIRHLTLEPIEGSPRPRRALPAAAVAIGVASLQYAGQVLRWESIPLAIVAVVLIVPGVRRLLPPGTLSARTGIPAIVAQRGVLAGCFFGTEVFVPLVLVQVRGLSPTLAGLTLTAGAVGWTAGSWIQGHRHGRFGRERLVLAGSCFITLAICLVYLVVFHRVPPAMSGLAWAIAGLGMGLSMASLAVLLFANTEVGSAGQDSAAAAMCDTLGQVTMVGIAGVLFAYLHVRTGPVGTFLPIAGVMAAVGVVGVAVATRLPGEAGRRQPDQVPA
jgi:MFS family permease